MMNTRLSTKVLSVYSEHSNRSHNKKQLGLNMGYMTNKPARSNKQKDGVLAIVIVPRIDRTPSFAGFLSIDSCR